MSLYNIKVAVASALVIMIALVIVWMMLPKTELVIDAQNTKTLPANFKEISNLKILSSAQFSAAQLKKVKKEYSGDLIVLDLRKEPHYFIDGNSVSWMRKASEGYQPSQLSFAKMHKKIIRLKMHGITQAFLVDKNPDGYFHNSATIALPVSVTYSERDLCGVLKLPYIHLEVAYQSTPSAKTVDKFVDVFRHIPSNTWLYLHGLREQRPHLFTVMVAIMKNNQSQSFQHFIHNDQLNAKHKQKTFTPAQQRFLKQFYQYCQANQKTAYKTGWSKWLTQQKDQT